MRLKATREVKGLCGDDFITAKTISIIMVCNLIKHTAVATIKHFPISKRKPLRALSQ